MIKRKRGRPPGGGITIDSKGKRTITYTRWSGVKQRCTNPNSHIWHYYGGAGVTMCDRWLNSYANFLSDMGECPQGKWIDRIDNSKGYEPGNCRWVTPKQSAGNRSKVGPRPDPGSLKQQAKAAGLPYHVVYLRIHRLGWDKQRALTTPVLSRGRQVGWRKPLLS